MKNNKEILIDFIEYAKSRHVIPILHSNINPLVEDYLRHTKLYTGNIMHLLPGGDDINKAAEDYGFRVPYDGSNKFYDEFAIKHFLAGVSFVEDYFNQVLNGNKS